MASAFILIAFAVVFSVILILLHFLKRELDPSWRMISEYEIGRYGWMMRVAFFCWSASVLALLVTMWPYLVLLPGTISRWWFAVIVLALFGAGVFKTDPITEDTNSLVNTLHKICGTIVILTFPIAATLATTSLLHHSIWAASRGWLIFAMVFTWVGMVTYFASVIAARAKNPQAGEPGGPHIYFGWPNRFNVLTYIAWIMIIAVIALGL